MEAYISAISHAEPDKIISNEDLWKWCIDKISRQVDRHDKLVSAQEIALKRKKIWIENTRRTNENENSETLAVKAVNNLRIKYWAQILDTLDWIYVWTFTSWHIFPWVASQIANSLWIEWRIETKDVNTACNSFLQAIIDANRAIKSWDLKKVLVVWVDSISKLLDWKYPAAVPFGDAAAGVILEARDFVESKENNFWIVNNRTYYRGQNSDAVTCKSNCFDNGTDKYYFQIDWPVVYDVWVKKTIEMVDSYVHEMGINITDFDYIVPHQANEKMLHEISKWIWYPEERVLKTLKNNWNTGAASIPLTLSKHENKFTEGDRLLLITFGAWFTLTLVDIFRWKMKNIVE